MHRVLGSLQNLAPTRACSRSVPKSKKAVGSSAARNQRRKQPRPLWRRQPRAQVELPGCAGFSRWWIILEGKSGNTTIVVLSWIGASRAFWQLRLLVSSTGIGSFRIREVPEARVKFPDSGRESFRRWKNSRASGLSLLHNSISPSGKTAALSVFS